MASSTLPSRRASRIRVDEISSPSSLVGSTTSKSIPDSRHHWPRTWTSPWRSWPKAKFGPSTIPRASNWRADDPVEELAGRQVEQPPPRAEHGDLGGTGFPQQGDLALGPDQRDRGLVGPEECHRVGIERDRQGRDPGGIGPLAKPADQALMAPMNAVEVADRHIRTTGPRGEVLDILDRDHRHPAPRDGSLATGDRSPLDRTPEVSNIIAGV